MKYLIIFVVFLASCTTATLNDYGYDETLENFDQTGWACDQGHWNVWIYYEEFNTNYVNVIFYDVTHELFWSKSLPESEEYFYQNKFFDTSRHCQPYDVKYTLYFDDKEPAEVWMYWNESEEN
jgi:hypothetical protein